MKSSPAISNNDIASRSLELVTVVFEKELEFFRLQARSLGINLSQNISSIHVLLNEQNPDSLRRKVVEIIRDEMTPFAGRVQIWAARDLSPATDRRGWLTQQILKLRVAHKIEASKYVVLDAKNPSN
jgi:Family of unknown function (DUF6492)